MIFLVALILLVLVSCNGSFNEEKCLNKVKTSFPNSKVYKGNRPFMFIVSDKSGIRIVKTNSFFNANISSVEELKLVSQ